MNDQTPPASMSRTIAALEARIEELEQALAVVPVLTAKLLEVEKERDALRGLIQLQ